MYYRQKKSKVNLRHMNLEASSTLVAPPHPLPEKKTAIIYDIIGNTICIDYVY